VGQLLDEFCLSDYVDRKRVVAGLVDCGFQFCCKLEEFGAVVVDLAFALEVGRFEMLFCGEFVVHLHLGVFVGPFVSGGNWVGLLYVLWGLIGARLLRDAAESCEGGAG